MNILVCGGSGFLGSALVPALVKLGHEVAFTLERDEHVTAVGATPIADIDLTQREDCQYVVLGQEVVYACAGVTGGSGLLARDPLAFVTPNILIATHLFKACAERGVRKVIYMSSTTAYPDTDLPMQEDDYFAGEPAYFNPGHTHRFIERLSQMYTDLAFTFLRPTMIYGPGDDYDPETSHVIPALIRKVAERQDPITLWGDGTNWRDAVHIDDMVRALVAALGGPAGAFNIASGEGMTVSEMLSTLCTYAGYAPTVAYDLSKPTMLKKRVLNIDKAKRVLGWEPTIRMADGLRSTLDWYVKNMPVETR